MASSPIKLVGADLDLTLFHQGVIPRTTQEVMIAAIQRGVKVGIVSGRPWHETRNILVQNGVNFGRPYPSFIVWREKFILWVEEGRTREETDWNRLKMREMDALNREMLPHIPRWLTALEEAGLTHKVWNLFGEFGFEIFYSTPADAEKARAILARMASGLPNAEVTRNYWGTNVGLASGTKGRTLRHVADCLEIPPEQTLAIGDSLNDLSMLDGRYGLRSAAVANAEPVVKEAVLRNGGIVAEKPGGEGVAEIFEKIVG